MTDEAKQWVAVTVLVFRGDRLLAMQRSSHAEAAPGLWEAISGRVRAGEDPHAAAQRELAEESGLAIDVGALPVDAYAASRNGEPMVVLVYVGRSMEGEVALSDEHDAYRWCTLAEFKALGAPPRLAKAAALAWPEPTA
ncbi:MAG: NUDIX domain-containing protein [Planctomycetota bacterium]